MNEKEWVGGDACLNEHNYLNDGHIKCLNDGVKMNILPKNKNFRLE